MASTAGTTGPARRRSGLVSPPSRTTTIATFQPLMATTWDRPATANASRMAGSIPARTPSRIPAASEASGSGNRGDEPVQQPLPQAANQVLHRIGPMTEDRHLVCPTQRPDALRDAVARGTRPRPRPAGGPRSWTSTATSSPARTTTERGTPTISCPSRGRPSAMTASSTTFSVVPRGTGSSATTPVTRTVAPGGSAATSAGPLFGVAEPRTPPSVMPSTHAATTAATAMVRVGAGPAPPGRCRRRPGSPRRPGPGPAIRHRPGQCQP